MSTSQGQADGSGAGSAEAVVRRRRRHPVLVLAVVLVVVAGVVWVTTRDDRPRVSAGEGVEIDVGPLSGYSSEVLVPGGVVRVVVGAPTDELPALCCTDEPAPVRPPEDGRFVGVEVVVDPGSALDLPLVAGAVAPQPSVVLRVAGDGSEPDRYPIDLTPEPSDVPTSSTGVIEAGTWRTHVGVEGEPDLGDLSVEVVYDEVVQVVDPASGEVEEGDAEALEDAEVGSRRRACGPATFPPGYALSFDQRDLCAFLAQRTPYVPGVGWADPGRTWVAVQPLVRPYVFLDRDLGGRRFDVGTSGPSAPRLDLRLAGEEPASPPLPAAYVDATVVLFEIDSDAPRLPLEIRARWSGLSSDGRPGLGPRSVTGAWETDV